MRTALIVAVLFFSPFLFLACTARDCSRTYYLMPDGTKCEWHFVSGGHLRFAQCEGNREYFDPPYFTQQTTKKECEK